MRPSGASMGSGRRTRMASDRCLARRPVSGYAGLRASRASPPSGGAGPALPARVGPRRGHRRRRAANPCRGGGHRGTVTTLWWAQVSNTVRQRDLILHTAIVHIGSAADRRGLRSPPWRHHARRAPLLTCSRHDQSDRIGHVRSKYHSLALISGEPGY
jgi:hypothetical protein